MKTHVHFNCSEALISGGVNTKFGTQVAGIEMVENEWVLYDKDREELGKFEWCVFTSHTVGHKRWEQVFGYTPPLEALAAQETSLKPLVDPLGAVKSDPIMVAMLAFKDEDAQTVMQLDFDMADGKLSLCARQTCMPYRVVSDTFSCSHWSCGALSRCSPRFWRLRVVVLPFDSGVRQKVRVRLRLDQRRC